MKEPYFEGFDARLAGKPISDNPYTEGRDLLAWDRGWRDQDHHLNQRDDALSSIGWNK